MPSKQTTQNTYEQRVKRALEYIHAHLDAPLNLEEVAAIGAFSPYHFHRIFRAFVGETLNEYVRRKRLEASAHMLVFCRDKSMTDIALSCGFSSSSNFSKAFSGYFGCSPTAVRSPDARKEQKSKIGELKRKYGKDFDPRKFYPAFVHHQTEEKIMDVHVIEMPAKRVAVLPSLGGYNEEKIYQTWDKVIHWAKDNKLACCDLFGVCYDDPTITPQEKCRYEAAVTVEKGTVIAAPFEESTIPAGKYAMAYYRGPSDPNAALHMALYSQWLPNSGFEADDFPLLERYLNDEREDGFVEMQILIKLKG